MTDTVDKMFNKGTAAVQNRARGVDYRHAAAAVNLRDVFRLRGLDFGPKTDNN